MLTRKNAVEFLQNSLNIKDVELELQSDREAFLNKLIAGICGEISFHTLFAFAAPEWKVTDFSDIEKWCMSGPGGHCGIINTFTSRLLTVLGFNTYLSLATITHVKVDVHVISIVKDLVNPGDIHLVDPGLSMPSFRAIPLNFDEESPVYQDSFLEYKYVKRDGMYLRMHGRGDLVRHNNPPKPQLDLIEGKWRRYYVFKLEEFRCTTIDDIIAYVDIRAVYFDLSPRASRYPDGKAIGIFNRTLFIEQDDKTLKRKTLETYEDVLKAYRKYFPNITKDVIDQAYRVYSVLEKSKL